MSARSYVLNWFEKKDIKSFKNSYMFKKGHALSTLSIFISKGNIKYSRLIFMDFNIDLSENPSQEGVFDVDQDTGAKIL